MSSDGSQPSTYSDFPACKKGSGTEVFDQGSPSTCAGAHTLVRGRTTPRTFESVMTNACINKHNSI